MKVEVGKTRKEMLVSSGEYIFRHCKVKGISQKRWLNEIDDYSQRRQFNDAGIGTNENDTYTMKKELSDNNASEMEILLSVEDHEEKDKAYDYRRHGKADFFAQVELKLNKSIEEAMKDTVQTQMKTMLANVFPKENPAALNAASSLDTIVDDQCKRSGDETPQGNAQCLF